MCVCVCVCVHVCVCVCVCVLTLKGKTKQEKKLVKIITPQNFELVKIIIHVRIKKGFQPLVMIQDTTV